MCACLNSLKAEGMRKTVCGLWGFCLGDFLFVCLVFMEIHLLDISPQVF